MALEKDEFRPITGYEKIVKSLEDLPTTWYPGLLIELVKLAYKSGCFLPGGASQWIKKLEIKRGL